MKLNKENKRGISLIVLIITIIVMIILAAAIILSLNSSGIIGKANKAKLDTDKANLKEAAGVALAEYELAKQLGESANPNQTAEEYVKAKLGNQFAEEILKQLSILNDGTIQILPTIPEGFAPSIYEGEKTISEGLVIYETTSLEGVEQETAMETYNQYVWVPVEGTFERIAWKNENITTSYVEPLKATTLYMDDISNYADEIAQYNAMKASVETNGGFYIARYEAGLPEGKTTDNVKLDGTDKPVSKKGANVWDIPWDTTWEFDWDAYDETGVGQMISSIAYGDDSQNGAAKVSKKTYSNAERHLIYGIQWDATMNFMKDVDNPNSATGKKYIYDSTGMGVYNADEPTTTGSSENYKVKNIYDMAGNVLEWTYEAYPVSAYGYRVLRGSYEFGSGSYKDGSSSPASGRVTREPSCADDYYGFRFVLYVK